VFVVASAREGFDPASVLFEREGVRRDTPPRRGEGQDAAAGTLRSTQGGSDVDHALAGHLIAHTITANYGKDGGMRAGNDCVPVNLVVGTLQANGKAAGSATQQDAESGLLVVHGTQDPCVSDKAFALGRNSGQENAVFAIQNATRGKDQNGLGIAADSPMYTLDQASQHAVFAIQAGALRTNPLSGPDGVGVQADHAYTLEARAEVQAVQLASAVRRLTPTECERLQGFPDGYTLVPYRNKEAADGPRYKALGNSMAVPVMRWIGERIAMVASAQIQEVA
jgi:DNA (cytosine-5)-methyltransferase 1